MLFPGRTDWKNTNKSNMRKALQAQARPVRREKASLFAPGSLTVETALVLPLFLFVVIGFLVFGRTLIFQIKFQSEMEKAAQQAAAVLALPEEGSEQEQAPGAIWKEVCTAAGLKGLILSRMGAGTLENYGIRGLSFLGSSVGEDDVIDLVASYQAEIPFPLIGNQTLKCIQRCRRRIWSGKSEGEKAEEKLVYVTAYGTVYHKDLSCGYLNLSIREFHSDQLETLGKRYTPCRRCVKEGYKGRVFVSEGGERYHSTLSCAALTRGIRSIPLKEAEEEHLNPCGKCGG